MQGVVAAFHEIDTTCAAIEDLKKMRLGDVTVYSPTIRHELEHAIDAPQSVVRRFTLIGGLLGVSFGYWVAIWSSNYWPLVVGGKAIASWIPYTIAGFEMMVMVGALSTVAGMFINSRIPRLTATAGYDTRFSGGYFGIFVACDGAKAGQAEELLRRHGAVEVRREA